MSLWWSARIEVTVCESGTNSSMPSVGLVARVRQAFTGSGGDLRTTVRAMFLQSMHGNTDQFFQRLVVEAIRENPMFGGDGDGGGDADSSGTRSEGAPNPVITARGASKPQLAGKVMEFNVVLVLRNPIPQQDLEGGVSGGGGGSSSGGGGSSGEGTTF